MVAAKLHGGPILNIVAERGATGRVLQCVSLHVPVARWHIGALRDHSSERALGAVRQLQVASGACTALRHPAAELTFVLGVLAPALIQNCSVGRARVPPHKVALRVPAVNIVKIKKENFETKQIFEI